MISRGGKRRREAGLAAVGVWLIVLASHARPDDKPVSITGPRTLAIKAGQQGAFSLGNLQPGQTYTLLVTLGSGRVQPDDRLTVELSGAGSDRLVKELHAGDPDLYLPYRPAREGQGHLVLARKQSAGDSALPIRVEWRAITLADSDRAAIEAEPNDSWRRPTSYDSAATYTARPMTSTTSKTPVKGNRGSTGSVSR